jgi:glutaminyl-tRNA synthetase
MGVLRPLKVIIDNYPEGQTEDLEFQNHPGDTAMGTRMVPFSRVLYIERDDFREEAPKKFFRLAPGREVRLRYAYYITCVGMEKDEESGDITALHCTYDPATKGGDSPDGRKVKGTIHWVSAAHALEVQVRLYDHLMLTPDEDQKEAPELTDLLNKDSLEVLNSCRVEPGLKDIAPGSRVQFERLGYFCVDPVDSSPGKPVFNRTVSLRDTWAKIEKAQKSKKAK